MLHIKLYFGENMSVWNTQRWMIRSGFCCGFGFMNVLILSHSSMEVLST